MKYLQIIATLILLLLCVIALELHFSRPATVSDVRKAWEGDPKSYEGRMIAVKVVP